MEALRLLQSYINLNHLVEKSVLFLREYYDFYF